MNNLIHILDNPDLQIVHSMVTVDEQYLTFLQRYTDVVSIKKYIEHIQTIHENSIGIFISIMFITYDPEQDLFIFNRLIVYKTIDGWEIRETNTDVKWVRISNSNQYTLQYPLLNASGQTLVDKLPVLIRTDI